MKRLEELLILKASQPLTAEQRRRLEELLRQAPAGFDEEEFEYAAAAIETAYGREEKLPQALRNKIAADARRVIAAPARGPVDSAQASSGGWFMWAGWLAAAGVLLAFLILFQDQLLDDQSARNWAEQRQQLLEEADDVMVASWTPTDDQASLADASGDVVWSNSRQQGYIRISGLVANEASQAQYQFWIFDGLRDDRFPVSGGVFDVPSQEAEIVLPIRAQLRIFQPQMFAVTVEQPGGVVVSDRSRIALLAQRP
ncbi:MAG TPA: anti-sigma factor [Acidobacteriota bacterium]|nr:anti-sigma factor [Acidobacteriota bacterium]